MQDETSVERRAAIIKKGAAREHRDLFADQGLDFGNVKESVLPPPSIAPASVGARNENSVLFRVDQLGGAERSGASTSRKRTLGTSDATDDEGVIDLKALASTPPPANRPIVAPLFSEPPPMILEVDSARSTRRSRPQSKLTSVLVGISAVAFVLVAGFGISLAFKGEEPVKHVATAPPAPPPPPPPTVAVMPAATPAPAETAPAEDTKGAKTAKSGKRGGKAGGKAAISSKSPAAAKSSGPKPGDSCGCHGEFNCILACTAKGGK